MIRYKRSLRTRVIVAFTLTGALLGSMFAMAAYMVSGAIERRFIADTLGDELAHYTGEIETDPTARPIPFQLKGYVSSPGSEQQLPAYLFDLVPGIHEISHEERVYHVAVQDNGDNRFYLVYDATRIERWEALLHSLLPISALAVTCLAFCLGTWLSTRVLSPVTKLAEEVKLLREDPYAKPRIARYGDDEVGDLARAFERLIQRLWAFAKREAEFTADVSHELRTPVTVVRTTTEVLLSQAQPGERLHRPLLRLDRAGRQMSSLIDVFLMLARESEPTQEERAHTWPLEPVIREILDAREEDLKHKRLTVELEANDHPEVNAPRAVLIVVFGNLLGNALTYTRNGRIRIILEGGGAVVEDTGEGIAKDDEPHIFRRAYRGGEPPEQGSGLGLAIVYRLCQRYGWRIGVESTEGRGTRIWLAFAPGSPQGDS